VISSKEAGHALSGAALNGEKSAVVTGEHAADRCDDKGEEGEEEEADDDDDEEEEEEEEEEDDVCTSSFADQDSTSLRKRSRLA
jgi:hypothetical protein